MADGEFLKWLASLGVGGVLAGLIFYFYRRDFLAKVSDSEAREKKLMDVVEHNSSSHEKLSLTIQTLTTSLQVQEQNRLQQMHVLLLEALKKPPTTAVVQVPPIEPRKPDAG